MGKVLKKYRFKLRKSNKIIFVFKMFTTRDAPIKENTKPLKGRTREK